MKALVGFLAALGLVVGSTALAGVKVKKDDFAKVAIEAKSETQITKTSATESMNLSVEAANNSKYKLKNWKETDQPADGSITKTRSLYYRSYDLYSYSSYTYYWYPTSFYYTYSYYTYTPYVYYWRPTYYYTYYPSTYYYWPSYVIIG